MQKSVMTTAAAASMTWLVACGAQPPSPVPVSSAAPASAELRVMVKLVNPSTDPRAIAAQVAAAAGTGARYLSATSPQWHALALVCGEPGACEAALQRLGDQKALFEAVQRDERKRIVTP